MALTSLCSWSAVLLLLSLSARGFNLINSQPFPAPPKVGGGIPSQPYLVCFDGDRNWPSGWGNAGRSKHYDDDSQLPEPFNLSGLNATNLKVYANISNYGTEMLRIKGAISEGSSQYFYARYVSYRPDKPFPKYYDNITPAIRGNSSVFVSSTDIEWQETCIDLTVPRASGHSLWADKMGPRDILILDKIIHLILPPGSSIKCSRDEIDEIRQFCGYQPETPETTLAPPTEEPISSTSTEPSTEPPTETPSEPFVQCLDDFVNDWPSDWTRNIDSTVCSGYACLPVPFKRYETDAEGLLYLKNIGRDATAGISWPKYGGNNNRSEYVYARYVSYRPENWIWEDFISPARSENSFEPETHLDTPLSWKEKCVALDHTNFDQERRIVVDNMKDGSQAGLVLDKLIYLSLPPGQTIECNFDEILSYCDNSQVTSTTATPPPPSVSPTDSTWRPSTEPPTCPLPEEWVDDLSDLFNSGWAYSPTGEYAYDTSELPLGIGQNLVSADGLFYFRGRTDGDQNITRYRTSNAIDSYVFIRYYIHHKSGDDTQQYYVVPVADKAFGVYYLDATSDSKWKEAFLHLDVDSGLSFQIGTTATSEEDIFIIDKIIFNQRYSH